jgi:hypothetical protein
MTQINAEHAQWLLDAAQRVQNQIQSFSEVAHHLGIDETTFRGFVAVRITEAKLVPSAAERVNNPERLLGLLMACWTDGYLIGRELARGPQTTLTRCPGVPHAGHASSDWTCPLDHPEETP